MWQRGRAVQRARAERRRHTSRPTYTTPPVETERLARFISLTPVTMSESDLHYLSVAVRLYLAHRFDILGSCWRRVAHGVECPGLQGSKYPSGPGVIADGDGRWLSGRVDPMNLPIAQRVWRLVDSDYEPIDWQLDFKSGYRWCERTWYRDISFGKARGADIKVPWELARMQHLSQLALAAYLSRNGDPGFEGAHTYEREFRCEVLDFISTNPPNYGVNWSCAMDVGIRITSWLIARDMFIAVGGSFDHDFEGVLIGSVIDHCRFIVNNLEWSEELRSNHYLADVTGLLVASAYLPAGPDSDIWLKFAVEEIFAELPQQFAPDGTNFEASTSYHRLSGEMIAYGAAFMLSLPAERWDSLAEVDTASFRENRGLPDTFMPWPPNSSRLPIEFRERLVGIATFTRKICKPNGFVPQIGDNDSGRFMKVLPRWRERSIGDDTTLVEEHLDHTDLVRLIDGLFGSPASSDGEQSFEATMVANLARSPIRVPAGIDPRALPAKRETQPRPIGQRIVWRFIPGRAGLRRQLEVEEFPCFGLYVMRSQLLYLAIRCGPVGQRGNGGHAHNDQLSIELSIGREDWIVDPGTYVYTPLPKERNRYRSVEAHFAPRLPGLEPAPLNHGLFRLPEMTRASCIRFGPDGFLGVHYGYGEPIWRQITLLDDRLEVVDTLPPSTLAATELRELRSPEDVRLYWDPPPFSPGYGIRVD